ncbi:hypothetical protein DVH24_042798 [Malus domestica]|uniref:Uncharacterized protein n=1 Tax=Malus domestica TaxID=3750 RepID=A0A498I3I3_MALDO|nr:hypothetical protein DVH24_042798 [Malus domestica]
MAWLEATKLGTASAVREVQGLAASGSKDRVKYPTMAKYGSTFEWLATMGSEDESLSLEKVDSATKKVSKPAHSATSMFVLFAKNEGTVRV